jgi:hypothetical protein
LFFYVQKIFKKLHQFYEARLILYILLKDLYGNLCKSGKSICIIGSINIKPNMNANSKK